MSELTPVEDSHCAQCGMCCKPGDYHPYAACLMFMACRDGNVVEENLDAVMQHAIGLVLYD